MIPIMDRFWAGQDPSYMGLNCFLLCARLASIPVRWRNVGVFRNQRYRFGGPYSKDQRICGCMLGPP